MLEVARRILEYLSKNPTAGDTLDGIVQWWLGGVTATDPALVEEALQYLASQGWLRVARGQDSRLHYRLEAERVEEVIRLFR